MPCRCEYPFEGEYALEGPEAIEVITLSTGGSNIATDGKVKKAGKLGIATAGKVKKVKTGKGDKAGAVSAATTGKVKTAKVKTAKVKTAKVKTAKVKTAKVKEQKKATYGGISSSTTTVTTFSETKYMLMREVDFKRKGDLLVLPYFHESCRNIEWICEGTGTWECPEYEPYPPERPDEPIGALSPAGDIGIGSGKVKSGKGKKAATTITSTGNRRNLGDKEEKVKEEKVKEEKVKEEKVNEEKINEEKVKEEKVNEEKVKEEKVNEEKVKEEKVNEEKVKEEKVKEEKVEIAKAPKQNKVKVAKAPKQNKVKVAASPLVPEGPKLELVSMVDDTPRPTAVLPKDHQWCMPCRCPYSYEIESTIVIQDILTGSGKGKKAGDIDIATAGKVKKVKTGARRNLSGGSSKKLKKSKNGTFNSASLPADIMKPYTVKGDMVILPSNHPFCLTNEVICHGSPEEQMYSAPGSGMDEFMCPMGSARVATSYTVVSTSTTTADDLAITTAGKVKKVKTGKGDKAGAVGAASTGKVKTAKVKTAKLKTAKVKKVKSSFTTTSTTFVKTTYSYAEKCDTQFRIVPEPSATIARSRSTCSAQEMDPEIQSTCSMGAYDPRNIHILYSDVETVTFELEHGFCSPASTGLKSDLKSLEVFFVNPNPTSSKERDFCWFKDGGVDCNKPVSSEPFTAQCRNGWATVSVSGGGEPHENKFHQMDGPEAPVSYCQSEVEPDFPDYNAMKQCYWEFKVPCGCSRRDLEVNSTIGLVEPVGAVDTKAETDEVLQIPVDNCTATDYANPISILSRDDKTVTFSVSQVWKGCGTGESSGDRRLGWIATDYVSKDDELLCYKTESLDCGFSSTYTAMCTDGDTVVDLYTFDEDPTIFGQADGTGVVVPSACAPSGDQTSMCHFRYILSCKANESNGMDETEARKLKSAEEKSNRFWFF
jgi:hypothetical protein